MFWNKQTVCIILSFSTLIDAYVISFVTSSKDSALKLMKKPRNYKVLINSYIVQCLSTWRSDGIGDFLFFFPTTLSFVLEHQLVASLFLFNITMDFVLCFMVKFETSTVFLSCEDTGQGNTFFRHSDFYCGDSACRTMKFGPSGKWLSSFK